MVVVLCAFSFINSKRYKGRALHGERGLSRSVAIVLMRLRCCVACFLLPAIPIMASGPLAMLRREQKPTSLVAGRASPSLGRKATNDSLIAHPKAEAAFLTA